MMHIRLEYNGQVLHEVDASGFQKEIIIGRSTECTWQTPAEDPMVGSRHARLFLKRGRVWVEDLNSKNGTWCKGKKVEQKKLEESDRINIGSCVLFADEGRDKVGLQTGPGILVLSGAERGQRKPIQGPLFTIGSDPKSNLLFLDDLISRNHAAITVKEDGSCWLKDLNSKNGTKVNDLPLRPDQERMLKDDDHIAVAHLEFSFDDGSSQNTKGQGLRRLAILVLTTAVAVGGYFIWKVSAPSAEKHYKAAEIYAAQENFEGARNELDAAISALGYPEMKLKAENLRSNLSRWESVLQTWKQAKLYLERGQWEDASRALGSLQTMAPEAWMWGTAGDLREQILMAKNVLDVYLDGLHTDVPIETLGKQQVALNSVLSTRRAMKINLDSLYSKIREQNEVIKKLLDTYHELDVTLNDLNSWSPLPATDKVKNKILQISKHSDGLLKDRAEKILRPVEMLDMAFQQYQQAIQLALQMRLQECCSLEMLLPALDSCSMDPRLSQLRYNIEKATVALKTQVTSLSALLVAFTNRVSEADALPPDIVLWDNAEVMAKVLACDCLKKPFPRRSRKEPSSDYDRFLGVEYFYGFLRAQSGREGSRLPDSTPFVTVLKNTMATFEEADAMSTFFARPENQWLQRNQVGLVAAKAQDLMRRRGHLVQRLLELAAREKGRSAIIAAGIALHVTDNPAALNIDSMPLKAWVVAKVSALNLAVEQLSNERERAALPKRIDLRKQIIELGLPGNPTVNSMWLEMSD